MSKYQDPILKHRWRTFRGIQFYRTWGRFNRDRRYLYWGGDLWYVWIEGAETPIASLPKTIPYHIFRRFRITRRDQ